MLNKIPRILSPELVKFLMEMGHGDEVIIADGNFPSSTCSQRLVRADGHSGTEILDAILELFPLDPYGDEIPVSLMEKVPGDKVETPIWDEYKDIVLKHNSNIREFNFIERFEFYERSKKAYGVIATGEAALYANILIRKGVVLD
ncbi:MULTISPECIES: RbsD/FucU family protein [unclassified Oceanispirochaeta]|uniref:RbsD/FucU family protein n=1 Tax=unclassified Oceanispirochaeta TaxID=2635722 RepID=UPI000E09DD07|nr:MULTISPECIES: RbsD/FucU domain-containing protein [unclassified Oceanispirochaeta]MBF9014943.1 fucose isomerase [Oceanispirochaeta sp. M2]NPD71376.1 fucose isomerase [Oceanispirochaeta sp. M1]RDG33341.1 fucose isomerase [Oceanispirochaeta sp. M1]